MKDAATLDKMYELNLALLQRAHHVHSGRQKKLAEVREVELKELVDKAKSPGRAEDAQAAQDLDAMCTRFEKKLSDLDSRAPSPCKPPRRFAWCRTTRLLVEKIQPPS